jgi:hypothetical protein
MKNSSSHPSNQTDNMDIHIPKSMDDHIPSTLVLKPNTPIEDKVLSIHCRTHCYVGKFVFSILST